MSVHSAKATTSFSAVCREEDPSGRARKGTGWPAGGSHHPVGSGGARVNDPRVSRIAGCIVGIQQRVINSGLRGAVAAMAMSGTRALTSSLGLIEQTPPEAVLHQSAPAMMAKVPRQRQAAVAELAHWAFGVVAGAGFGLLPLAVRRYRWAGAAYGVVVLTGFEGRHRAGARAVPGPTCTPGRACDLLGRPSPVRHRARAATAPTRMIR